MVETSGALRESLPLNLPPGRSGLTPALALEYDSQKREDGMFGYGWTLSLPVIERQGKAGVNRLYQDEYFSSTLSGELATTTVTDEFRARVDEGEDLRYVRSTSGGGWTATDKRGMTYAFGATAQARATDPADPSRVAKWFVEEVRDANDNVIRFTYAHDNGAVYPDTIFYTGHGSVDGPFRAVFLRESRPDPFVSYHAGFRAKTDYRIAAIEAYQETTLVARYTLAYTPGANGFRSLLGSVIESRRGTDGTMTSLPPAAFSYTNDPVSFVASSSYVMPIIATPAYVVADFNGDGLNDVAVSSLSGLFTTGAPVEDGEIRDFSWPGGPYPLETQPYFRGSKVALNLGNGQFASSTAVGIGGYWGWRDYTQAYLDYWNKAHPLESGWRIGEVNGDGIPDFFRNVDWTKDECPQNPNLSFCPSNKYTSNVSFGGSAGGGSVVELPHAYVRNPDLTWTWIHATDTRIAPDAQVDYDRVVSWTDPKRPFHGAALAGDLNGDGLTDLVGGEVGFNAFSDGSNWQRTTSTSYGVISLDNGRSMYNQIIDVNGDGLGDLVRTDPCQPNSLLVHLNTGSQFEQATSSWSYPYSFFGTNNQQFCNPRVDGGVRLKDVNGDGLVDLIHLYRGPTLQFPPGAWEVAPIAGTFQRVFLNTGTGWATSTISIPGLITDMSWFDQTYFLNGQLVRPAYSTDVMYDWNGDGMTDWGAALNQARVPDMLAKITYPAGGSTDIEYAATPQQRDGNGALAHPHLPSVLQAVAKLTTHDGFGGADDVSTYRYEGGKNYFNGHLDRTFAGFKKVVVERGGTRTTTYYHQADGSDPATSEPPDHYAKIGKPYRTETGDIVGNLYERSFFLWDVVERGPNRYFVAKTREVRQDFDGNATHRDSAVSYAYDPATGNLSAKTEWGEVVGAEDGTFTDIGADKYATAYQYATDGAGRYAPSVVTKTNQTGTMIEETKRYYDDLPLGSLTIGNSTKEEHWKEGSSYVATRRAYNAYGLVEQELDPRGKPTTYGYDAYHLYPETATNALNQTTTYEYDYGVGKPKRTTDPNNASAETDYDGFGRISEERVPDAAAPGTVVLKTSYLYTDTPSAVSAKRSDYLDGVNAVGTYTYFDGLGRRIQERREAEQAGQFAARDWIYDSRGLVAKASLPYFSAGSARTAATVDQTLYAVNTYDALDRVTSVANAVGTVTHAFANWKETVTDARGKPKALYHDAYGNLVQVDEVNGTRTYSTYYAWNGLGKLTGITDALANVRNFSYDGLGRRTGAEDLHASGDTTFGTWIFGYDDAGNPTSETQPGGKVITRTFDDLNRLKTENDPETKGTDLVNTYDACLNGIGRLCSAAVSGSVTSAYEYDVLGRAALETKTIQRPGSSESGGPYATGRTYDRQGNILEITHPDGGHVRYTYNVAEFIETIERKEPGGSAFSAVVSNLDYSPLGQVTREDAANGAVTVNTYDSAKLYRLANRTTTLLGSTRAQDITYTYDPNGNVEKIVDMSQTNSAKTTDYTYDDLNRLLSAAVSNAANGQNATTTYQYSAIGNITYASDVGTYEYRGNEGTSYANPHAATLVASTTLSYDQSGNLASADSWTYGWDYRRHLRYAAEGTNAATSYGYDHEDQRAALSTRTSATYSPTQAYRTQNGSSTTDLFVGDLLLATVEGGTPHFVHSDHLAGSNVVTSASGTIAELLDYHSYGTTRIDEQAASSTFSTDRTFTGHLREEPTALTYMGSRYYRPTWGRFISEDAVFLAVGDEEAIKTATGLTLAQYLQDPQLANGYAYARDNPMAYVDKSGDVPFLIIPAALGAAGGVVAQYASDVMANYNNGVRTVHVLDPHSSPGEYGAAALKGATITLAAKFGVLRAGLVAGGTTLAEDKVFRGRVDLANATEEAALTALTAGFLHQLRKVSGARPFRPSTRFFFGAHARDAAGKEVLSTAMQIAFQQPAQAAIHSTPQTLSSLLGQLQSLLQGLSAQLQ